MYESLAKELGVPYRRCGALVLAFDEEDKKTIADLKARGETNGVTGLEILDRETLLKLEPNLNPEVVAALSVPTSAIVSPYEMAFALADDAALNGVRFRFDEEVVSVSKDSDGCFTVQTDKEAFCCKVLVNCAGAFGAEIHNQLSEEKLTFWSLRKPAPKDNKRLAVPDFLIIPSVKCGRQPHHSPKETNNQIVNIFRIN